MTQSRRLHWREVLDATTEVVCKRWRAEQFEVYLTIDDTPARLAFDEETAVKLSNGNTQPLEWRLSDEVRDVVLLEDPEGQLIEHWFESLDRQGDLDE